MNTTIELSYIVPLYFNQKNYQTLIDMLNYYNKMEDSIRTKIHFILVDDHSSIVIKIPENIDLNYSLYRITDNITWNQAGARNLGVTMAKSSKIILTDSDHLFPEKLLKMILKSKIPKNKVYKFKRENEEKMALSSPCNIFYTTKSIFFSTLGYDEEFCGAYGYEDVMFRDFLKRLNHPLRYFTRSIKIIASNINREKAYHSLERNIERNKSMYEHKSILLQSKKPFKAHSRTFLNFNYTLKQQNIR